MGKFNLETYPYQVLLSRFWHKYQEPPVEINVIYSKRIHRRADKEQKKLLKDKGFCSFVNCTFITMEYLRQEVIENIYWNRMFHRSQFDFSFFTHF